MWIVVVWLAGVAVGWLAASCFVGKLVQAMEGVTASTMALGHRCDGALTTAMPAQACAQRPHAVVAKNPADEIVAYSFAFRRH